MLDISFGQIFRYQLLQGKSTGVIAVRFGHEKAKSYCD